MRIAIVTIPSTRPGRTHQLAAVARGEGLPDLEMHTHRNVAGEPQWDATMPGAKVDEIGRPCINASMAHGSDLEAVARAGFRVLVARLRQRCDAMEDGLTDETAELEAATP